MTNDTKSTIGQPVLDPTEDQRAWDASEARLSAELRTQFEQNSPVAMTVSPRVCGEVWRYAAYVAEREGCDIHAAVAHLLELGVQADSPVTREPAVKAQTAA